MKETERIEFKKSTSELKPGVISIASMLNKNGYGELYFGIRNDGSVCGQQIGEKTTRDVSVAIKDNIKPNIVPSIETITMDDKEVIKVVCRGEDTPYSAYNRYYIRSDDEDLIMSTADLESFLLNKNYDYSKWEKKSSGCGIDSVDEDLLIEYVNGGNESGRIGFIYRDAKTTLEKLNLVVADELNADSFELVPVTPYTAADLNWRDRSSRVNKEHDDPSLQDIELAATEVPNWSEYDTVLFGYPIWWREASWVVNSFIKNNDFTGKTVVPFCTSTSSGLGDSGTNLEKMAGTGNWLEGIRFSEMPDENSVREWARGLNIK